MRSTQTTSVDRVFRAFADRTRLRILSLLTGGELCVCDLVAVLNVPQPTASRHLAYLRRAGLVLARKQGPWTYYRLAPAASQFHRTLIGCLGCCLADVPELRADAAKAANLRQPAGCCPAGPKR
jgi:ArsR family transcriptional regulator